MRASRPFDGRAVVSQGGHNSILNGRKVYGAVDFIQSPFMRRLHRDRCHMPLKGQVLQIVKRTPTRDGSVILRTPDNKKHVFVHIIPNPKLKKGLWYKQGTKVGVLDQHPINATGVHWHYHIVTWKNRNYNMFKWYRENGRKNWYQDPNQLLK